MESFSTNCPKKKPNRNVSLDMLKFISSFLIVCIHFPMVGEVGKWMTVFARFAVPMFFMLSGYYVCNNSPKKIKAKLIHILKIYLVAFVLYFCFNMMQKVLNGEYREAIWYVSTYVRIQYTSRILFFNESITAIHLWFLGALIYCYILWYVITKAKIKENLIYAISLILLLTHLVLGIGFSVFGVELPLVLQKNYVVRNFLFMGFPLFSFGQFVKKKEALILKTISGKLILLLIAVSVLDAFLSYRIDCTKELYFGSILLAFSLFILALKMQNKSYHTRWSVLFTTSTNVYILHVMLGDILAKTKLNTMLIYGYIRPIVVFSLSVILALFVNRIFRKKK